MNNDSLNYHFAYLVNVMACELLGINYLGQKRGFLKDTVWPLLTKSKTASFEKLAIAIFQKFSLKKRFCLQMLRFGVADWLLEVLARLTADTQQYELQYGLALLMNLTLHRLG